MSVPRLACPFRHGVEQRPCTGQIVRVEALGCAVEWAHTDSGWTIAVGPPRSGRYQLFCDLKGSHAGRHSESPLAMVVDDLPSAIRQPTRGDKP
jgi:hypothetical protein